LINNRQGGRRRGRGSSGGGGSGRQSSGSPGPGNRTDNRQRGNAAQLLEKYKSMARDAQMQGDRVQTENYLQFAEHYYRVLNENRARFEEQRPRRDDFGYDEDEDQDEAIAADGSDEGDDRPERYDRQDRQDRPDRQDRYERQGRPERQDRDRQDRDRQGRDDAPDRNRQVRDEEDERPAQPERGADQERNAQPHRNGEPRRDRNRPRRDRYEAAEEVEERISLDVLPPAISIAASAEPDGADEPAKVPRRRARRPRDEGDEIAPAA
jgi:hypothetical protein